MDTIETIESKVKFIMETDWLFQEPIDFEHKKYVLLAYFKKIDEKLSQNKLYPTFIELSLHLASLQTLIKEQVVLSTNKNFTSFDDEVLLKELTAKSIPNLQRDDMDEVNKIIKHSSDKFLEYFNIVKSYWTVIYDSIELNIKRNRKSISKPKGYMVYTEIETNDIYVWEYILNALSPSIDEYNMKLELIYEGNKKDLSLNKILESNSKFTEREKKVLPVFDFKSSVDYPIEETLLPLFKRKMLAYIFQSIKVQPIKKLN
jgi:hypothetical protein